MKLFLTMAIVQVILYLITAFVFWDINWILNLGASSYIDRFMTVFAWALINITILGISCEILKK